jgi:parallel beta-helix repeat protein
MKLAIQNRRELPAHLSNLANASRMSLAERAEDRESKPQYGEPAMASLEVPISVFTVTNGNDSGPESLRQAILDSNSSGAPRNSIEFAIGSGPQTIRLQFGLPAITREVHIDATTQPGFAGVPLIEIDGRNVSQAYSATIGLHICASNCTVRGLSIERFTYGVKVDGHGNTIDGNVIGARSANGGASVFTGIFIRDGHGNYIQGNTIDGNVIGARSASDDSSVYTGIVLQGGHDNFVRGNTIISPEGDGMSIDNSDGNTIGGPFPWDANTITGAQEGSGIGLYRGSTNNVLHRNRLSGNAFGVWIDPSCEQNVVSGNKIAKSTLAGIEVQGSDNTIGTKTDLNTIDGAACVSGIVVESQDNSVNGNFVCGAC